MHTFAPASPWRTAERGLLRAKDLSSGLASGPPTTRYRTHARPVAPTDAKIDAKTENQKIGSTPLQAPQTGKRVDQGKETIIGTDMLPSNHESSEPCPSRGSNGRENRKIRKSALHRSMRPRPLQNPMIRPHNKQARPPGTHLHTHGPHSPLHPVRTEPKNAVPRALHLNPKTRNWRADAKM